MTVGNLILHDNLEVGGLVIDVLLSDVIGDVFGDDLHVGGLVLLLLLDLGLIPQLLQQPVE